MLYLNIFVYMIFSPCVLWLLVKSVKEINLDSPFANLLV